MSIEAVPTVDPFGETNATDGLPLSTWTVTPPCSDALSVTPLAKPCRPEPVLPMAPSEMVGCVTLTVTVAAVVAMNPGMLADTVVDATSKPSKATPPAATVVGEK